MAQVNRGAAGERQAAVFLRKKGYKIEAANYHSRFGEIDIIASKGEYIVFAEVKTRACGSIASPAEFVTAVKAEKIRKTAMLYLAAFPSKLQPRFDVIEVYTEKGNTVKINHIENAF